MLPDSTSKPNPIIASSRWMSRTPSILCHFKRLPPPPHTLSGSFASCGQILRHPRQFVLEHDSAVSTLLSEEGIHQGDPLGPFLFCIGMHEAYVSVSGRHPQCFAAYMDDITILGPADAVKSAYQDLKQTLSFCSLSVNPAKCTFCIALPHRMLTLSRHTHKS